MIPTPPFTPDNCEGYSQEEMEALNAEFRLRWRDAKQPGSTLYTYADGRRMSLDEAIKHFQNEVSHR